MPYYHKLGIIPPKRHTQFRKSNGQLFSEQLFSTEGFSNDSSLLYHHHPPTQIIKTEPGLHVAPEIAVEKMLPHRSFDGFKIDPEDDFLTSRKPVLVNNDCHIVLAAPRKSLDNYFYKNADADELIFVHEGQGSLHTIYGELLFNPGDYLVVPRGTIYQIDFTDQQNRLLIVESFSPIRFPRKYLSKNGQLLEQSPFCERDIRVPENLNPLDIQGDFLIKAKKKGVLYHLHYGTHPFDVVGGTGVVIHLLFRFTTLSRSREGCINRRRFIRLLKRIILWFVLLFPGYSIIIPRQFRLPTITVILTAMK